MMEVFHKMKRNMFKIFMSCVLMVALLAAPVSAFAASNVAYLLMVAVSDAPGTYVRSGNASDGNAVVGSLRNGTLVLFWGQTNGQMLYVMTADGTAGYVYQGNMRIYGAMNTRQIYVTSTTTGVYTRSGAKAMTVGANVPVIVYGFNGDWAYVRNINGVPAYIPSSNLRSVF